MLIDFSASFLYQERGMFAVSLEKRVVMAHKCVLPERRFPTAEQYISVGGAEWNQANASADWSKTGQEPSGDWWLPYPRC